MKAKDEHDTPSDEERPVPPFLVKTYNMVQDRKTDDIISWNEKGDAFVVKKQHEFSQNVLPNYFRTNCFSSFVRQLNFYGFRKRSTNMSTTAHFKHKNFKRDRMDLLHLIKKKTSESSNLKQSVTELQKEVAQLKEQYKQIWGVQHQILVLLTQFAPRNSAAFPHLQSPSDQTRFMYPNGMADGFGPRAPNASNIDLNALMMAHLQNGTPVPPAALLNGPQFTAQNNGTSPTPTSVGGGTMNGMNGSWKPPSTATIQDVTETDLGATRPGGKRGSSDDLKMEAGPSKKQKPVSFLQSPLPSPKSKVDEDLSLDSSMPSGKISEEPWGNGDQEDPYGLPSPLLSMPSISEAGDGEVFPSN
eukprot:CAMPEP_0184503452 /NCGR_PEP_ID=MMETSP0113_2-20130426/51899_1 /TAXON_ID=91329 /ORGANISM="Norrisiella sphaerica, Strain BC52" /LENGTH=358 /DNA_ID=CAMNT_0026892949 /DNA_START=585 /DNA_END=1661 /DNA_ORIENTATION=+